MALASAVVRAVQSVHTVVVNVVVFALWYWETRTRRPGSGVPKACESTPTSSFAQMATPNIAPSTLGTTDSVDYFYLAFTNATTFSPTDVIPLARAGRR